MERVILHSDINSCYASIELLSRPELRGRPLAVGGDPGERRGIVLAKDEMAKRAGVRTGMALWQARAVCPELQIVRPRMDLYLRFSRLAMEIYSDYTDRTEPYGIDESWLDVTESVGIRGSGESIAQEIRRRIKRELGISVSIGVSYNKIFAKLGSDYRKPDAVTLISRDNYREIAWPLPAADLLMVGPATTRRLSSHGIRTIGELALTDERYLQARLGKAGVMLRAYARGEDEAPVALSGESPQVRSIGNSVTLPRDLVDEADAKGVVYMLSDSVAGRLREHHLAGSKVEISMRDSALMSITRQTSIPQPTQSAGEIARASMELLHRHCHFERPLRSIGVRVSALAIEGAPSQLLLFRDEARRERELGAERAADEVRRRFGARSIVRGVAYPWVGMRPTVSAWTKDTRST